MTTPENTTPHSNHHNGAPTPTSAQQSLSADAQPTTSLPATPPPPPSIPTPSPAAPEAPRAHTPRQRLWLPITTTAVLTAILASLGTATAINAWPQQDEPAQPAPTAATQDTTTTAPVAHSTSTNPDWQAVTSAVSASVVAIEVDAQSGSGQGSGVIIDSDGRILTNNHVVESGEQGTITVTLDDGRILDATITGLDAATDLAVITLTDPPADLVPAIFADSNDVTVGDSVIAIGNPLGLSQTATTGIVSALNRPVTTAQTEDGTLVVTNAIQIDAAINPGNSGGPLFNAQGEVIGITSSIATMSQGMSGSSGSIGLGFAIPANLAQNIGDQLIANGEAEHAFLGVSMTDGTAEVDGATRQGALVAEVSDGSPADNAGITAQDLIISLNGKPVTGAESLTGLVRELQSGQQVPVEVIRDGTTRTVTVTLASRTENATTAPQNDDTTPDSTQPNNIPDLNDLFGQRPGRQG